MPDALELAKQYFQVVDGSLVIGGIPFREIVKHYPTPLYIIDSSIMESKLKRLRAALPSFTIYYSLKANPNPDIIGFFIKNNCGLEIASGGELQLAMRCGCESSRIVFAGPGKSDEELEAAVAAGILEIHVESSNEIDRLALIAAAAKKQVGVSLRVNPHDEARGGAVQMGGKSSVFGFDEELVLSAYERICSHKAHLVFRGLHVYCGTQILDHSVLKNIYHHTLSLSMAFSEKTNFSLHTIDFGGGLGIPYFEFENELAIEKAGKSIESSLAEIKKSGRLKECMFIVEPGRYLVGEAGVFLTRVLDTKVSRGTTYIILDGGMNNHLAASGNLGQIIKRNFPIAIANKMDIVPTQQVEIVGPLCTPIDTMGRKVKVPPVDPGDYVAFFQSGAYGLSASPIWFLNHSIPGEIIIKSHKMISSRKKTDIETFLTGIS